MRTVFQNSEAFFPAVEFFNGISPYLPLRQGAAFVAKGGKPASVANANLIGVASIADVRRAARMAVLAAVRQSGPSPSEQMPRRVSTAAAFSAADVRPAASGSWEILKLRRR